MEKLNKRKVDQGWVEERCNELLKFWHIAMGQATDGESEEDDTDDKEEEEQQQEDCDSSGPARL
ncbi:hypothetical protein ACP4OV_026789 [Aristida adscensionis]